MEKWADYVIFSVHYNHDKSRIEECKVAIDDGEIGTPFSQSRNRIVENLQTQKTYITIFKGTDQKYRRGDNVIFYMLDGEYFIRTDGNRIKKDNLGELPEY